MKNEDTANRDQKQKVSTGQFQNGEAGRKQRTDNADAVRFGIGEDFTKCATRHRND